MKKLSVLLVLVICFGLSFSTVTSAKDESKADLKKKIISLEKQVKTLKTENSKLNKKVPKVISGNIYHNGVRNGSSNFLKIGSKSYVEIENIIPLLTSYGQDQVKFDYKAKALYLGVMPRKGVISLTDLDYYSKGHLIFINRNNLSINNKFYTKNITSTSNMGVSMVYKINGKYSDFNFSYGVIDGEHYKGLISIYGDGKELFNTGKFDYQEDAKNAKVDIRGVKFLEVYYDSYYTAITNPTLVPTK